MTKKRPGPPRGPRCRGDGDLLPKIAHAIVLRTAPSVRAACIALGRTDESEIRRLQKHFAHKRAQLIRDAEVRAGLHKSVTTEPKRMDPLRSWSGVNLAALGFQPSKLSALLGAAQRNPTQLAMAKLMADFAAPQSAMQKFVRDMSRPLSEFEKLHRSALRMVEATGMGQASKWARMASELQKNQRLFEQIGCFTARDPLGPGSKE